MAPLFHMEALLPAGSISPKINSILQSHVYPRLGRVFRALVRFKSLLLHALGNNGKTKRGSRSKHAIGYHLKRSKIASFMKLHPSWWAGGGSSAQAKELCVCSCHEPAWNNVVAPAQPAGVGGAAGEYCGYLSWLEEEESTPADELLVVEDEEEDVDGNEIDRLAEKFIAMCHAKFLLEKQESYRRYQEMMARSV